MTKRIAELAWGLAVAGTLAGCQDYALTAILPAPDAVLGDTKDAAGDVGSGGADADANGVETGVVDAEGGLVSKISGLVVHDTVEERKALWSVQKDFEIGQNGVYPWGDWPKTYIVSMDPAASMVLLGKYYIAVASESKLYTGGPQATVTFSAPADLYMIYDDRWTPVPWAPAGWTDTGWNLIVYENLNRPMLAFSVLARSVPAGTLDLPLIGDNTGYNYVIIVN
jgi:hypothetical protein